MPEHSVIFKTKNKTFTLAVAGHDTSHAQAQALDISRALDCESYEVKYTDCKSTITSELFKRLALNDFSQKNCVVWEGKYTNNSPCFYALGKRYYVRTAILKYLDIPSEGLVPKTRCKNTHCINPYHFEYCAQKNTKLSGGDVQMLLAFQGQGASVTQIAKALNVHRSTIYRKLKDEHLHSGIAHHRRSAS